jgi:cytochrome c nitrite reductase small subunit
MVNHYYFKGKDGLRHATIFTLRTEPQVIQIKEDGAAAVQKNCIRCHTNTITDPKLSRPEFMHNNLRMERKCWECHRETPHGKVKGLSTTPYALIPLPGSPVPSWLKNLMPDETKD